jgi:hypothetical protein
MLVERTHRASMEEWPQVARWFPAWVDKLDTALDQIEHSLSIQRPLTVARLRLEPYWDPLRDHPRFAEILEKYGEDESAVR